MTTPDRTNPIPRARATALLAALAALNIAFAAVLIVPSYVNDRPVAESPLRSGDRLRLGRLELTVSGS